MPTYDVLQKSTGEVTERFMTISAMQEFLAANPDFEITFRKMQVGDPVSLGIKQPPSDFTKYIISPIEKHYFGKRRDSRFRTPAKET
jgi:hypothetical protein